MTEENKMPDVIHIQFADAGFNNGAVKIRKFDTTNYFEGAVQYVRADQLTKTAENVTCAAVSNGGESMDEKKRAALDWFKRFVETDGHGNYDTILAVLQAPSVCTHSGGQSIQTVPASDKSYNETVNRLNQVQQEYDNLVAVADKLAEALNATIKDLKTRIDMGNCDGHKEDDCYVFPWGNSVMYKIDEALAQYNNFKQGGA